jgi:dolichol-phosphate mannosyltransferase
MSTVTSSTNSSPAYSNEPILIVIPTYNERENLPLMAEALFGLGLNVQILVVDDNSPDGTGQLAEDLRNQYDERVHILHRTAKNGLGPAYIAGFQQALTMPFSYIVQMDADFSHQPKHIPEMLERIGGHDVVVGSRFIKGGGVDPSWGWHRKALSLWANRIYTPAILGMPIYDATGGYRLWRADTLRGMGLERIQSNGYVFQVEMIYVAYRLGYQVAEMPIFFPDRQLGESKMSPRVALEAAARVFEIRNRHHHLTPADKSIAPS